MRLSPPSWGRGRLSDVVRLIFNSRYVNLLTKTWLENAIFCVFACEMQKDAVNLPSSVSAWQSV